MTEMTPESLAAQLQKLEQQNMDNATVSEWANMLSNFNDLFSDYNNQFRQNTQDHAAKEVITHLEGALWPVFQKSGSRLYQKTKQQGMVDARTLLVIERMFKEDYGQVDELENQIADMVHDFSAWRASLTVDIDGQTQPMNDVRIRLNVEPDRTKRKKIWLDYQNALGQESESTNKLSKIVALRKDIAKKMSYSSYTEYAYHTTSLSAADGLRLANEFTNSFEPVMAQFAAQHREKFGIDTLRPWDVELTGFTGLSVSEFDEVVKSAYTLIDPAFGEVVTKVRGDLDSRLNKTQVSYTQAYYNRADVYIHCNLTGAMSDLIALSHEYGHAIHLYSAQPYFDYWDWCYEDYTVLELVAYTMEYICIGEILKRQMLDKNLSESFSHYLVEQTLSTLIRIATREKVQQHLYASSSFDEESLQEEALSVPQYVDWSGFEQYIFRCYEHEHVFRRPFYNIQYTNAILSAWVLMAKYKEDPHTVLSNIKKVFLIGGRQSTTEFFNALGLSYPLTSKEITIAKGQLLDLLNDM